MSLVSDGVTGLFDLQGRVALITGGTRGLGREMAFAFAAAGADVVVASRKPEACAEVADEIHRTTGRQALGHPCHVGDWDALQRLVDAAWDRFGRVDVVVNNAGMSPRYPSPDAVTEPLFDKVIDVNLKGPFRLTALAGPRMVAAGGGSIINVSSVAAVRPTPDIIPYAAAKAGLEAMTVAYARAYGPAVRVNAIQCGAFLTDISTAWDMDAFERRARTFALGRGGRPAEIAGTALYLASDASSYTTGAVIRVDGGAVGAEPPVTGGPDR
jgi:NAD(P)-dependent dehydrogenase (short-subunit alcohol dehydrogenase family)